MPRWGQAMTETGQPRRIRSFVRRAGRQTRGQERALAELWPRFGLGPPAAGATPLLDLPVAFGRPAPCILEIGFGNGDALVSMAAESPERNFLGAEVHVPGIGHCLLAIERLGLANVRLIMQDAVEVLRERLPDNSLAGVHLYFPDPWHKKRHHKRRLIQPAFVGLLCDKLKPGGRLHLATDWENYAEQMWEVLDAEPRLANIAGPRGSVPRPEWRRQTHFETRGQKLGHGVWDLVYTRR